MGRITEARGPGFMIDADKCALDIMAAIPPGPYLSLDDAPGFTHEGLGSYGWGPFGEGAGAETLRKPAKGGVSEQIVDRSEASIGFMREPCPVCALEHKESAESELNDPVYA